MLKVVTKITCILFLISSVLAAPPTLASDGLSTPESRSGRSWYLRLKYKGLEERFIYEANYLVESRVMDCAKLLEQDACSFTSDCSWVESERKCLVPEDRKDEIFDREMSRMQWEVAVWGFEVLAVFGFLVSAAVATGILVANSLRKPHVLQVPPPARP